MTRWRVLSGCFLLALTVYALTLFEQSDFVQDYVAARGWLFGLDPNGRIAELIPLCCSDALAAHTKEILQTAHPPFATLVALPFALLPWQMARLSWLILSWLCVIFVWEQQQVQPLNCVVTIGLWLFGLSLGTFEPLLFVLIAGALHWRNRSPTWAGVCLGFAAALKVYPVILIAGFWISRQRRASIIAACVALVATVLTELVFGIGTTQHWLAYTRLNTEIQVADSRNLSLIRLVHFVFVPTSPTFLACIIGIALIVPILRYIPRSDGIRPLLPVMLLSSPICWNHYLGVLALTPLTRVMQVCLAIANIVIAAVWLKLVPGTSLAPIGYGPLMIVMLLLWYKYVQHSLRKTEVLERQESSAPAPTSH